VSGSCEICGKASEKLHTHHISYKMDVTVELCPQCHCKVHKSPDDYPLFRKYDDWINSKKRGKSEICKCGQFMRAIFVKYQYCKKATMRRIGWICLSCQAIKIIEVLPFFLHLKGQKTRGKHQNCAICGNNMKRIYIRRQINGSATWKVAGWVCLDCFHVDLEGVEDRGVLE